MNQVTFSESVEVFICLEPTDMRRSFDSLSGMVRDIVERNPLSGSLFIFVSKRKTMMKILYWDRTGFCQHYKRLENGTFSIPVTNDDYKRSVELRSADLQLFLDGINVF